MLRFLGVIVYLIIIPCYADIINSVTENHLTQRLKTVSTENIADALERLNIKNQIINNSISHINPMNSKTVLCGKVSTVLFAELDDNHPALGIRTHDYLDQIPKNTVLIIADNAGTEYSLWGRLLTHYAYLHKILGVITNGSVRDVNVIQKDKKFSVFAVGITSNHSTGHYKVIELQKNISINGVNISPGDYVLASASATAIAIIHADQIKSVIRIAEKIKASEKKILSLMDQGYTLKMIDKQMLNK
jgi:regulator of RNase E activity RraA